jgi:hypothetical protein
MTDLLIDPTSLLMTLRQAMDNNYHINRRINEYFQREESRARMTEQDLKDDRKRNEVKD